MFTFRWEDTAVPLIDDGEPALINEQILSSCAFYNEEHLENIEIWMKQDISDVFIQPIYIMETNRSFQGRSSNVPENNEHFKDQLILSSSAYLDFVPISAMSIRALVLVSFISYASLILIL